MRIAIGCDEAAFDLKQTLREFLIGLGHEVVDYGTHNAEPVLYPDIGHLVASAVAEGKHDRAVLLCGTGIGMAITANKVRGVRAAQAHDTYSAERAMKSNDARIITLGGRVVGPELAKSIVSAWLGSEFEAGRSGPKVERIEHYEHQLRG